MLLSQSARLGALAPGLMYTFDYGIDGDNKPPSITLNRLSTKKLKLTGSEMFTFVKLFGVFVGDLVEEEDEFWQLYLLLHDIVMLSCSTELPECYFCFSFESQRP